MPPFFLLARQPPLGSGRGHSRCLEEPGKGLRGRSGTIAGNHRHGRPPQPTFLRRLWGMLSLKTLSPYPSTQFQALYLPSLRSTPPMWINQVSGASRALSVRWAWGQGLDVSPPHWIRGSEEGRVATSGPGPGPRATLAGGGAGGACRRRSSGDGFGVGGRRRVSQTRETGPEAGNRRGRALGPRGASR